MYIPKHFQLSDRQEIIAFMRKYNFATIINTHGDLPVATHLPFIVEERGEQLILLSHFAKGNPQSIDMINGSSLVLFVEPHAYISPKNYEKEQNVPTWNYLAIHAYGKAAVISDKLQVEHLLENMIRYYEADYLEQWQSLSEDYRSRMMNGITAFEIVVDNLQAKSKLSQNRTAAEKDNIISSLSNSVNKNDLDIADYMLKLKQH